MSDSEVVTDVPVSQPSSSFQDKTLGRVKWFNNKVGYGFNLGAGYQLNSGLNFNIRYYLGLADIPKGDTDGFKNSVFQVAVGYNF